MRKLALGRLIAGVCALACVAVCHAGETSAKTMRIGPVVDLRRTLDGVVLTHFGMRPSGPEWIAAQAPLAESAMTLPSFAEVSGTSTALEWLVSGAVHATSDVALDLKYTCAKPKLELLSQWRETSGIVEHSYSVTNRGDSTVSLPLVPSLRFAWKRPAGDRAECLWVEKTAGGPTTAGVHRVALGPALSLHLSSKPYSADEPELRDAIPWMSVCDHATNQGWFAGIEYSGRVALRTEPTGSGAYVTSLGLDPSAAVGYDAPITLAPGEKFVTPTVFVGAYSGDFDDGSNLMRRWVESHLCPPVTKANYPVLTNNSWGSGMAVDEKLARSMIDESTSLGLEMFHIDAGWFRGVGDWNPRKDKFPNGIATVADYAHSKGLLFGLWTGWTQGGNQPFEKAQRTVLSVFDPAMKGWFTTDYPRNWKPAEFTGADVCLADARAEQWCLDDLRRLVPAYKLDLLEHDQRMIVDDCSRTDHGHSPAPVDVARRATDAYYRIYDTLRRENPGLMFEDCVNGGRMVDFGVVKRVDYISICDSYDPLSNRRAFHDNVYCLPAPMCEAYISNLQVKNIEEFKSMLRSGMMGWCTVMCDTTAWSPEQHDVARHQFDLYKNRLRPLIREGNIYHVSERPDGVRWDGMQYYSPRLKRGALLAFRGSNDETSHTFHLKRLDPVRKYSLTFEDASSPAISVIGRDLMEKGIEVALPRPNSSEIVFFE